MAEDERAVLRYGRAGLEVAGHGAVFYVAFGPHHLGLLFRLLGVLSCWWAIRDLANGEEAPRAGWWARHRPPRANGNGAPR